MLVAAAVEGTNSISADSIPAHTSGLAACGEVGLAAEVLRTLLDRSPGDSATRLAYAQLLLDNGDPSSALAQAALLAALDPSSRDPLQIEADALAALGRAEEAFPLLDRKSVV